MMFLTLKISQMKSKSLNQRKKMMCISVITLNRDRIQKQLRLRLKMINPHLQVWRKGSWLKNLPQKRIRNLTLI